MNYFVYPCMGEKEYIPKCTAAYSLGEKMKTLDFFAYVINE